MKDVVGLNRWFIGLFSGMRSTHGPIVLFFVLLFFGLFLGDGKQGVIEVYGAAIVLILWLLRAVFVRQNMRPLFRSLYTSWMLVFGAVAVSMAASSSLGFSVSWAVRLLSGYLMYRFFYDLAGRGTARVFVRGFLVFVFVAGAASVTISLIPSLQHLLPSMNLVSLRFGHNHLADLLVFVTPMVFLYEPRFRRMSGPVLLIPFMFFVFFTMARLAWVIISVYILIRIGSMRAVVPVRKIAAALCTVAVFGLFVVERPSIMSHRDKEGTLLTYLGGQSAFIRMEYWKQAWEGFLERPFIGTGPGTFSLTSYRYQRAPLSSSWFAHSEALQTLSELGLAGVVAFGWLVFVHVRAWRSRVVTDPYVAALISGCFLTFIYALAEFNLDYFVTWLVFCSAAGLVSGYGSMEKGVSDGASANVAAVLIGAYYFFWTVGNGFGYFTKRNDLAFFSAPFDSAQALLYLDGQPEPGQFGMRLALVFHRKNPEVLASLGRAMNAKGDNAAGAGFLKEAVFADPQNMSFVLPYVTSLTNLSSEETGKNLLNVFDHAFPSRLHDQVIGLEPDAEYIGRAVHELYLIRMPNLKEGYVSLLYAIGYQTLMFHPDLTGRLWTLARDLHPDFAATHIELARLYQYTLHDDLSAQNILRECEKRESPREQCRGFLGKALLPPGDFYEAY